MFTFALLWLSWRFAVATGMGILDSDASSLREVAKAKQAKHMSYSQPLMRRKRGNARLKDMVVGALGVKQAKQMSYAQPLMRRKRRNARLKDMVGLGALGGKSFHAVWTNDGKMHLNKMSEGQMEKHESLLQDDDTGKKLDMSFNDWAKTAPWTNNIQLMKELLPFIEMEHPVPLKPTNPVELEEAFTDEDCKAVGKADGNHAWLPSVFSGSRPSSQQAFALDVSMLGFDLDVMEIKLHELNQVVDVFCIIEMPVSHKGEAKPLLWARNMNKPRFAAFKDKILHVVVELPELKQHEQAQARDYDKVESVVNWEFEVQQEDRGMDKIREAIRGLLAKAGRASTTPPIVMSFGDADEIASPRNWKLMKACQPQQPLETERIDNAAMMAFGQFKRPFSSDFPVPGLKYSFGNPTFHNPMTWDPNQKVGLRGYGRSGRHLLGGWHMTYYAYPPFNAMKQLTSTSYGHLKEEQVKTLRRNVTEYQFAAYRDFAERTILVEQLERMQPYDSHPGVLKPPAVVQQNPERYEVWFEKRDRRLDLTPASQLSDLKT